MIMISNILPIEEQLKYGLDKMQKLSKPLTEKAKEYMLYHRNKFYDKQKNHY